MAGAIVNGVPVAGKKFEVGNKSAEKWTEDKAIELGEELLEWISEETSDPTERMFMNGFFLIKKKIATSTVTLLANKFSSFRHLYEEAKKISEYKLAMHGTGDRLNAQMTKFVLQNNHNWTDKKDIQQTIKELPKIKFTSE
jgi:hypothetical protein